LAWLGVAVFSAAVLLGLGLGGRAERAGAGICLVGGLLTVALQTLIADEQLYVAAVTIDLAMAIAFAALAVKVPEKLWPGVAAVSQTLLVAFSATRMLEFPLSEKAYIAALNLSSLGVALSLASGTLVHRLRSHDRVVAATI